MKFIKENKYIILTILVLSSIMFHFINLKQGFHEDEIFSYGSSNYKYDNVFRPFGDMEVTQEIFYNKILKGNTIDKINNYIKYLKNPDSFEKDEILTKEIPIWKTKENALEYLAIQDYDVFNYFSVYYNQVKDVHPPLFYFLVHFISTLFYNSFSKYIIFSLNLIFFIGTLIVIKKIMDKLDLKHLSIPTMILYGTSIAGITTVMFQRMYMMLTFFSIMYLYLTIKLIKNDFKIDKKLPFILTTLCGFLTQYYFCIYIALIFIIISIYLIIKKRFKDLFKYFIVHLIPALIGIIFYPSSIEDIFFSYRGIGSTDGHTKTLIESFMYYINQIIKLFSLNKFLILFLIIILILIYKIFKKQLPKINKNKVFNLIILIVPTLLFIMIISKIAPFLGENYTSRYIMLLFPIIAIILFYILSFVFENKKVLFIVTITFSIIVSGYGLIFNEPIYLYKDYSKVIDIANKNSDKYFVYIYDNNFTHLNSMPEFSIYKGSLILNKNIHDFKLLDNEELNNENEFILCIKGWLNQEELLNKVLKSTNYSEYEVLLDLNSDVEAVYYKITRK